LPFQNAGYAINNRLHSFALELNSRSRAFANRFFASYNRFRDFRSRSVRPSHDRDRRRGVTYTTIGHEPFSIHNILDQDVWQFTDNFSVFQGKHVFTVGANFEKFSFFNSFNIFRNGVFFLSPPDSTGRFGGSTFSSLDDFFLRTDPNNTSLPRLHVHRLSRLPVRRCGTVQGEDVSVGQLGFYVQDEYPGVGRLNLTYGLRSISDVLHESRGQSVFPRPDGAGRERQSGDRRPEASSPNATALWSPRVGFNWNASGDRRTQVRGGTGIFTGRVPFVWIGNVLSNPGGNPNLFPAGRSGRPGPRTTPPRWRSRRCQRRESEVQVAASLDLGSRHRSPAPRRPARDARGHLREGHPFHRHAQR